jgi:ribosomal-protein-alanine N-acetyltransferase
MAKKLNVEAIAKRGFSTPRFLVRPLNASDYIAWSNGYDSMFPKQNEYDEEKPKDLTRAGFRKLLKKNKDFQKKRVIYPYGIFEKKTGRLMGHLWISLLVRYNVQSARIAYSIFNNYWKRGYGHEVVEAAIQFAFRRLRLHRLEAEIQAGNRGSIALAKAIGMQYEGFRRKAVFLDGKWVDHQIYSIVAEDRGIKMRPSVFNS